MSAFRQLRALYTAVWVFGISSSGQASLAGALSVFDPLELFPNFAATICFVAAE
jgi:hypothetical protein